MDTNNSLPYTLSLPGGSLTLHVGTADERVWYELRRDETAVVERSHLEVFDTDGRNLLAVSGDKLPTLTTLSSDTTWEQPWGEQRYIRNHYVELSLQTDAFTIRFRLFHDAVGFRYELHGDGNITISREATEFTIDTTSSSWWIPALGQNHYEHLYRNTPLSDIPTAHTPLTIKRSDDTYIAIHEAALYDYGAMNLYPTETGLTSAITPRSDGTAGVITLPFTMPWRTIIVTSTAHELGNSKIMLNLNEPSKIRDTSWIQPMKFMGIWWAMFIGYATWASGPKHGATTANAIRYINAARDLGIRGLLIEGWNEGWDGDWTKNGEIMNHMQPYPDFDIQTITSYAASQGVEIIGHHETSGNIQHYEWQLPEAYDYYKHFGVRYVKTGYVSPRLNTGDAHSSQIGVQHYQKTVELAAERHMMLDIHEPVKGTGIERTWPNLMTREGVMGQEYEGGAITPEHTAVLPFTRLLAGPLDYTPGLFNLSGTQRRVHTTLAKQLAFYVTMYSPMQMAADLPEHYKKNLSAFTFIAEVPVNWDKTVPLAGEIGDYYMVARKDRHSDDWFVGAVTDEDERTLTVDCSFLPPHMHFQATIYRDSNNTHWQDNPEALTIETQPVTRDSKLSLHLAPGGGFAIHMKPEGQTSYPY